MKITINKPAVDRLTDDIVAGFKRIEGAADSIGRTAESATKVLKRAGDAADAVGRAADSVTKAVAAPSRRASWGIRAWAAVSWADLLGRFTGR